MTYVEAVEIISKKSTLPKKVVAFVLKSFQDEMKAALRRGETVKLPRFGTFYAAELRPRKVFGREVPQRSTIRFKQSRSKP